MDIINVADGKARFSEIVARAEAGEDIVVARRGKPVVRIVAIAPSRRPLDIGEMRAHLASMTTDGPMVDSEQSWPAYRAADRF